MPLVHVKKNYQITIPLRLRNALKIKEGDLIEAEVEGDLIVLRPKSVVDKIELKRQEWVMGLIETGVKNPAKVDDKVIVDDCKKIRKNLFKEKYIDAKK